IERDLAGMDFENALAAANVGSSNNHATVESTGPEQSRVEHVRTVSRGHQDHAVVGLKTVHFDEKLIERLFALVMAPAQAGSAMASDSVDLIDKYDAGSVLFALFEQVSNAA